MTRFLNKKRPQNLPAAQLKEFECSPQVREIEEELNKLSNVIKGRPAGYPDERIARQHLYQRKRNLLRDAIKVYWQEFDELNYDREVAFQVNPKFQEIDAGAAAAAKKIVEKPSAFSRIRRYLPQRDRLASAMDQKTSFATHGREIVTDLLSLVKEVREVIYYPDERPVKGFCPEKCGKVIDM